MKRLTRKTLFLLILVFIMVSLLSLPSYAAKASPEKPPGTPPRGTAIQSDAQGTKLVGVLYLESFDFNPANDSAGFLRVAVRLRKGNQLATFYTDLTCSNSSLPCKSYCNGCAVRYDTTQVGLTQAAIIEKLQNEILGEFFNGNTDLTITLKIMEEFDWVGVPSTQELGKASFISLSDIELAVK